MSMNTAFLLPLDQIPPFPVRPFSVEEYLRLTEIGVLGEDDKVELLDGWITPKMTRNTPHDFGLSLVHYALVNLLPVGWHLKIQAAVVFPTSVLEPDLAVVAGGLRTYANRRPGPADVALIVEVSDSSLRHDRNVKGPIYADAGIPIYWIANVVDKILEVYTNPGPGGYQHRQDYTANDAVPLVIAGQVIAQIPGADLIN